jgi:hypothetical protein
MLENNLKFKTRRERIKKQSTVHAFKILCTMATYSSHDYDIYMMKAFCCVHIGD